MVITIIPGAATCAARAAAITADGGRDAGTRRGGEAAGVCVLGGHVLLRPRLPRPQRRRGVPVLHAPASGGHGCCLGPTCVRSCDSWCVRDEFMLRPWVTTTPFRERRAVRRVHTIIKRDHVSCVKAAGASRWQYPALALLCHPASWQGRAAAHTYLPAQRRAQVAKVKSPA
jgi:hypothetical protein